MTNPYQPPQTSSENRLSGPRRSSTYVGGKVTVVLLAAVAGTVAAIRVHASMNLDTPVPAFAAPAIVWIATMVVLVLMLRGAQVQPATKIGLSLLMAIPAYILYVPVCTFGSMFTTEFMGSNGYAPTVGGVVLVSVLAFVVILLVVAAILRRCLKHPVTSEDTNIVSTNQAGLTVPFDEQRHE